MRANLPFSAAKIEGELTRGSSIDVALMMVGKRSAAKDTLAASELVGADCARATHFVRSAIVGAFAVTKGTAGRARAAASIFGASASGASSADKRIENRDGDPAQCKVRPGDAMMPEQCRAAIVLELRKLGGPSPTASPCPTGFVRTAGICAPRSEAKAPYACRPDDHAECKEQCDRGNTDSCYQLALRLEGGLNGARKDEIAAATLWKKLCKHEDASHTTLQACINLASSSSRMGDEKAYGELLTYACDRGKATACHIYGTFLIDPGPKLTKDVARGIELVDRACRMGEAPSCSRVGTELIRTKTDPARGLSILERMCDVGNRSACHEAATLFEFGSGVPKDLAKARSFYARACKLGLTEVCGWPKGP